MEAVMGNNVKIKDSFWSAKMELVKKNVIPYQWEALNDRVEDAESSYAIANFKIAADITTGRKDQKIAKKEFHGCVFQDSDLAKWIEAAAFSLNWSPDENLEKTIDETIDLICSAQQPDGYFDTYYIINGLDKRFTNLADNHELYCLGHFIEAACAYYNSTGKDKLLKACMKYVDLIDANFGKEEGKKKGYPGHEVLELALMKLYDITGDEKHLKLAKYFINQRGQKPLYFEEEQKKYNNPYFWKDSIFQYAYYQAHKPVREQNKAVGHAVRAMYLYSGMADVARETHDESLIKACNTLWEDVVKRQMYITGAVGSSAYGESFTFDYDLPNETIYGETCASIGLVFWAMRMLKLNVRGEYADVIEKALYNGIISGISLDGKRFFYVNPLEVKPKAIRMDQRLVHVKGERQKWFGCACCPPNIARILSSLGDYIYTQKEGRIYQNLFIGNELETILDGRKIKLEVTTSYPWDNLVQVKVIADKDCSMLYAFRNPGWCKKIILTRNGCEVAYEEKDGYIYINEALKNEDIINITFDMPVRFVKADSRVREDIGKTSVMRGPIVYCLEEVDNGDELQTIHLGSNRSTEIVYEKDLLGGVVTIKMTGMQEYTDVNDELYYDAFELKMHNKELIFVPYFSWANRKTGEMRVWVHD